MTNRDLEILGSLLKRANPPPVLYRYRRPNEFTLKELTEFQLYAAAPVSLNDSFESSAPVQVDHSKMKSLFINFCVKNGKATAADAAKEFDSIGGTHTETALRQFIEQRRKDAGVVCFSEVPNSIRMWSYYADSHEGICVGYKSGFGPFIAAMKVVYRNPDSPLDLMEALATDPAKIADHVSLRKAAEWEFEREHRLVVSQFGSNPRLLPFPPEAICEIRLGARIKADFRKSVLHSVSLLKQRPKIIQIGCDQDKFVLTETEVAI
jgi:hypothetical protein